jgi:signal transduction histidine kinase
MEIKDNGIGFHPDEKMKSANSFGIQSLMQRAKALGGKANFESDKNGTILRLKTPIQ